MNSIAQIRQQFPQYNDLDDDALLQGLHRRFYSDMPFDQFRTRLSERPEQQQPTRTAESVGRNWLERNITDPVERGYQGVAMGVNELRGANPDSFFGQSPEEAAASIARRQRRLEEIPRTEESQAAMRRAAEADGIVGAVGQIARSGDAVTDIVTESIGANPVAGGVGLLANVTPVPVLRQILGGLAGALGFPTEFLSSRGQALMQAAQAAGVDPRDPQALAGLIREINADPERRAEIRNDALTRAGIIAGVDAAAGYGAGRLATRSAVPRIAGAAGIEGVGGGVGEAAAQLATTGEIDQTEIAAEIVGGGAMGAAGNITRAVDPQLAARSQRAAEDEELARALRERAETEEPERPILQLGTDIPRRIETPYGAMTPNQLMEFAEANVEAFPALRGVMAMPAGETAGLGGGETGRFTEGERIRLIADILNDQPNAVGDARARGESEDARAAQAEISRLDQQIANTTNPARLDQLTAARSEAVNRLGEITQRDSDIAPRDESAETRRVLIGLEPEDRALIERFFPNPSTFALQRPEVQAQFLEVARQRANRESNATRQIREEIAGFDRQIARTKQPILLARLREARADAVQRLGDVAQREVEGFRAAIEQAPRMAADADRQIGEITQRIGEDPVALVTSTLPVTEADFRRATPDARERLVARAQQLQTTQTPGARLRTTFDASQSEREASPPNRPNAPAFASKARGQFEDTTRAASPTATEIEAQGTPTAAQIRQANETQDRSDQQGRLLDQLRGERARTLDASGRLTELRRAEAVGTITPREQQELARLEEGLQTIEARINAAMLRADDLSRRAGFGSQSASGTSDRLFPDFEEGRDGEATPGFGPDPQPGETQSQYLERQARERAQREQDTIRDRILREQEARARAREEAARDKADADRANAKQRENTKSAGKPDANGFYSVDEDGFLVNGEKLVVFSSKRTAANWMVPNRQAAYWDFVIRAANSEEVMLRAKPAYYADKRAAKADARAEQPGQSETPRTIGGPQFSALNTDQQPAAEAAPEATPEADRAERRARANAIIDARLERLKAMGKQGRLARNAVVAALKDRRFTPEQMLAAFRIAEAFTRVVGGGKAVRLEFRQNLDDMRDQAGGAEPQALIEAINNGPNGVEAVARFSLSDNNLPVANMTAPHEAFHVLQALFKGSEPKLAQILDRAFPAGKGLDGIDPTILRKLKTLRPAGANRSYYDFLKAAVPNEQRPAELQAYVFGALMDAQMRGEPMSGMTPAIIRMVNYFAQMKRQVGALLRGDGVTAAGIMERAGRGEYGRLDRVEDTAGAQASTLKPTSSIQVRENPKRLHSGKVSLEDIANFFDRQFRKRETTDPRAYRQAVKAGADEVAYQLSRPNSGLEWYDEDIKDVFRELSTIYPILNDPDVGDAYRQFFTLVAAPMSNGTKAKPNVVNAAITFGEWLKTGTIPTTNPVSGAIWGQRGNTVAQHLDLMNSMLRDSKFRQPGDTDEVAMIRLMKWMQEGHKIRDISAMRARHGIPSPLKGAGSVDDVRLGAYIFGPKFGPFFANLNGFHDETVDSWASRTFYRHFGQLRDGISESGMADAPKSSDDRAIAKRWLRDISALNGIDSRRVQAVLWFYEKEVYNALGHKVPLEVFSDGAREYVARHREYEAAIASREGEGRGRDTRGRGEADVARQGTQGGARAAESDEEVGPQFSALDPAALRQFSAANPSTPLAGNRAWVNATSGITKGAPPSTMKRAILGGIFGALPGEVDQAQTFGESLEVAKRAFKRNTVNIAASVEKLDQALKAKGIPTVRKLSQLVEEARMNTGRMELISEVGGLGYDPAKQTIVFDKNVPSMLKALQGRVSDRDIGEFQKYMIARRESDLRKAGRKGLSKKADAEIQTAIRLAEQQHPEWRDAAADIQKINKAMLDIAVKTGTLDAARAKQLAGMMYTPFYRYADEDATGTDQADVIGPKLSQTLSNPDAFEKAVHEGGEIGDNLIANMLRNYDAILRSSMKNVAAREVASNLAKLTDANGNPLAERIKGSRKTGDQNVVITKENGQDVLYKINAPDIYLAMTGLPKAQRGALFDAAAKMASWFRIGITSAPSYMWANLIRGRVVSYAQEGLPLFSNVYRGAKEFYNASTSLTDFQAQTGFGGFSFGMGDSDPGAGFMRALRAANGEKKPKDLFFNFIDGLQKFSEATEMADRLLLAEHLTKKGMDPREARFQAYLLAPYSRHGLGEGGIGKLMQFLTPLVPFLNSKIQSMNRMMENEKGQRMIRTPLGFKMPADRFIRSLLITGFSVGAYMLAQATAPEEWEKENPDTILRYDIFYVGGERVLIPRAFEFGVAFGALPIFALEAIRKGNGDDLARAVAQSFFSTYGFSVIPQAAVPVLEIMTGYNFFQGRPLENRGQQALPAEERVNEGTPSLARVTSQGIMGFQRAVLPPNLRVDLSPIEIQRLIEGYTGTLGMMALGAFDSVLAGSGALPARPESSAFGDPNAFFGLQGVAAEFSGLKRFIRGQGEQVSRSVGDFYRMKGDLDQLVRSATVARDSGDYDRYAETLSESGAAFGARTQLNRIGDQIGKLSRQIEMVRRQGGDPAEMRERLEILRDQRNMIADRGADLARAVGLR